MLDLHLRRPRRFGHIFVVRFTPFGLQLVPL